MDVDTRLLRYFAAVAEEENLTQAAQRLYVSQPALTKQIRRLETLLGVPLFTRSRAGMSLTEAGRSLARSAPSLLADWHRAVTDVKAAAAREGRVMRVGFLASAANEQTQQIIAEFATRRPGWRVDMRQSSWSDPTAGLAAGSVDVALLRLPFPGQESWRVQVLLTEPRCVVLPSTHRLADRTEIAFPELHDEPFVAAPDATGAWRDYWLAVEERRGELPRIGAVTEHPDDWLNAIANGYGIALAPESSARYYRRPGVVFVPVTGVAPSQVGVVWSPANDGNSVVHDFVLSCVRFKKS
ncbi:LysR family transcriptional regulator [Mycolicibacterium setense]|uniref:LysR family transcriptional regulator n=1 Tax=Mycolicibacterium setense TaxID=431269 RepID=UPI00057540BF|nr:LysR family transcriptional regulator [Mycolicibacterium setense]KHO24759.1 LysR family transcriptional regulator [Mycolicibacterium setense]MCV7110017.1 LysR family transcriptional regulator [Mycolicibacterium setense]